MPVFSHYQFYLTKCERSKHFYCSRIKQRTDGGKAEGDISRLACEENSIWHPWSPGLSVALTLQWGEGWLQGVLGEEGKRVMGEERERQRQPHAPLTPLAHRGMGTVEPVTTGSNLPSPLPLRRPINVSLRATGAEGGAKGHLSFALRERGRGPLCEPR
ncbi:hypothetical protein AAFF_G00424840 [Aldrovandia affinis]|uniref:Uncharacterized protein n=1 Tax=Aldrovandia affinis TaxID=143900 RepID=A0AAD7T6U8_9TELE|nr:hypothetical protein AAFF_G00424840 [Aldrovandia affinis]